MTQVWRMSLTESAMPLGRIRRVSVLGASLVPVKPVR
jgi:hypothetical protein